MSAQIIIMPMVHLSDKEDVAMKDEMIKCVWCGEEYPRDELHDTDLGGKMCDHCIQAVISHGEDIAVYY